MQRKYKINKRRQYFKENDNTSKFAKHVSTATSVIFSYVLYKALQIEFISRRKC